MSEIYFCGGYYLVEGSSIRNWMNPSLIPATFHSLSNCICSHHPDISVLTWMNEADKGEKYRQKLRLSAEEFQILQNQADQWFENEKYAWGQVFLDLSLAREFATNYLSHIKNIKLLAIAKTPRYRELFLQEAPSNNCQEGVYRALLSHQTIDIKHNFLGYEILGYEYGWFHSFVCNQLETDFVEKLDIELNQYGLIDRYDLAIRASDYVNFPDTGAEPSLWLPWAVVELKIF